MTKFIFVRHGQSEANKATLLGEFETLLSEEGIQQAHETGRALKGIGVKVIACSAFPRAKQTAEAIAEELGIDKSEIVVLESLGERRLGALEGQPRIHEPEWYRAAEEPDMEPIADVIKRCQLALQEITELSEKGLVVAVGHGTAGYYLLQVASGILDVKRMTQPKQLGNASFAEVEVV